MENSRKEIEPKQVIVIRKDLNMSAGKLAAQVAHASLAPIFKMFTKTQTENEIIYQLSLTNKDQAIEDWLSVRFTKVIVYVKSEEALLNVYKKAEEKGLPCALIKDAGFTEFSEPTFTVVGIGPCYPDDFEGVTSKLRLFNAEISRF